MKNSLAKYLAWCAVFVGVGMLPLSLSPLFSPTWGQTEQGTGVIQVGDQTYYIGTEKEATAPGDETVVEVQKYQLARIKVEPTPPDGMELLEAEWVIFDTSLDWEQFLEPNSYNRQLIATAPPGQYKIAWRGQYIDYDAREPAHEWKWYRIVIAGTPDPVDPIDPIDPIDPPPDGEVPFPADKFSVMIIKEASGVGELSPAERNIFTSARVLQYLRDKAGFFRVWDDDYTDEHLENVPENIKTAYRKTLELADGDLPYIAISTGTTGFSGPLPGSVDEMMALLERYGG